MNSLRRAWLARRHREDGWATLFAPVPDDEWVSLDLETTGLDPRRDAILSLAAVPVQDDRVQVSQRFERLVHPGRDFDIESIRHHRLTPADVADAPYARDVVADFLRWLGPRRVLGYHIGFDLAMLARPVQVVLGHPLPNPSIDVAHVYAQHVRLAQPHADVDLSLDAMARHFGIPLLDRHTALGDATSTALLWLAMRARGLT